MTLSIRTWGAILIALAILAIVGALTMASAGSAQSTTATDAAERALELKAAAAVAEEVGEDAPAGEEGIGVASNDGCESGRACMWYSGNFEGEKRFADYWMDSLGWTYYTGYTFRSAKNEFNNRRFRVQSAATGIIRCLDAGEQRATLPVVMSLFNVGGAGSTC